MITGKRRFLYIELKEAFTETVPEYSLFSPKRKGHFKHLLDAIDYAAASKKIAAIMLAVREPSLGWAQIEELVSALDNFRSRDKQVTVFLESAGNKEYFLACAADSVYLAPSGNLNLIGLRAEMIFFKDVLRWLGVQPELTHIGKYKSAGDMFTHEGISEAQQEQVQALIEDLQQQLIERVSACRRKTREQVAAWLNEGPYSALEAKERDLVDDLLFEDQVITRLEDQKLVKQELERTRVSEGFWKRLLTYRRTQVALIVAEGMIASGKSRRTGTPRMICGAETMARFLADARKRKRVRGVVLRVNSPGGSSLASDIIWREVQLTAEKKPLVVSMGDTAASGGYYIATAGAKILAQRATVTGSIGVIGGKFVIRDLLEKLRIRMDSISGAVHAGFYSALEPFAPAERETMRRHMQEFYRVHFVPKVAKSRNRDESEILKVAQGRVWSGERAQRHGLVDRIGGIREAIDEVRNLCRLPPDRRLRVVVYSKKPSFWEMLVPGFGSAALWDSLGDLLHILRDEVLALLPFEIHIK